MKLFLQRHAEVVTGVLSGFDRLVLRGSLRLSVDAKGLLKCLCHRGIGLKDFGRLATTALLAARNANVLDVTKTAA